LSYALEQRTKVSDKKEANGGYNLSNRIPLIIPEEVVESTIKSYTEALMLLKKRDVN
jgi:hypothetical protein